MRIYLDFILLGPAWGQPGDVEKKKYDFETAEDNQTGEL